MKSRLWVFIIFFGQYLLLSSTAGAEEVFIGNPGKSLNFFPLRLGDREGLFQGTRLRRQADQHQVRHRYHGSFDRRFASHGLRGFSLAFYRQPECARAHRDLAVQKPTFYVVARPDIKSAADLKGKTIGISSFGSDTDLSMKVFAQSGKLDPEKDMKRIVAGATSTRLQGLKAGSIDATTLSPPFNVYAEQIGRRVLAYVGDFLEFPQSGFTISDATLKSKRDLIKRLLRGTLRVLQFTLKNRAETVRFIAKDYKLQEPIADKVYSSLLLAMSENGLATDKGLKVMVETLGTAVGKNVDFPPDRLVDYTLLREVQKETGVQ